MNADNDSKIYDRRSLLTGAAGVALGSGTATTLALTVGNSTSGPHLPSAGEQLMVEHGVLKRILLAYRAIATKLSAAQPRPRRPSSAQRRSSLTTSKGSTKDLKRPTSSHAFAASSPN